MFGDAPQPFERRGSRWVSRSISPARLAVLEASQLAARIQVDDADREERHRKQHEDDVGHRASIRYCSSPALKRDGRAALHESEQRFERERLRQVGHRLELGKTARNDLDG